MWLISATPWDGAPNGRISAVLQHVQKRQRGRVADFLKAFQPLFSVRGENRNPWSGLLMVMLTVQPVPLCCSVDTATTSTW